MQVDVADANGTNAETVQRWNGRWGRVQRANVEVS
jgi:hypothetical protein